MVRVGSDSKSQRSDSADHNGPDAHDDSDRVMSDQASVATPSSYNHDG